MMVGGRILKVGVQNGKQQNGPLIAQFVSDVTRTRVVVKYRYLYLYLYLSTILSVLDVLSTGVYMIGENTLIQSTW